MLEAVGAESLCSVVSQLRASLRQPVLAVLASDFSGERHRDGACSTSPLTQRIMESLDSICSSAVL